MSHVELSALHRKVTTVLTNEYQRTGEPVSSETLAEALDRSPGTVHNTMQRLADLGLVDGVPGPGGGYEPTERAFEKLDRGRVDDPATVTLSKDFDRLSVIVDEITFPNVTHPEACRARVHCQQSVDEVSIGDPVVVGPTPGSALAIAGEVLTISDTHDSLLLDVAQVEAPLEE